MKLQTLRRGTAAAAVLTLSLTLAACGEEDEPATTGSDPETSEAPPEEPPAEEPSSEEPPAAAGPFGDACAQVPTSGEGSVEGMTDDPVATAASNNPLLSTLVTAVGAVPDLAGTLDSAPALTVFAPANPAFEAVPPADLQMLIDTAAQPDGALGPILSHHVIGENLDPTAVVGEQMTLAGDTLTIEGDPEAGMTVSDGTVDANVICGGVQTANATVYVIDAVLTGVKAGG